jgi:hypothetical protein
MRARRLQRPNRGGKQKVSQGYSPADENAGLAYAFRDDGRGNARGVQTGHGTACVDSRITNSAGSLR